MSPFSIWHHKDKVITEAQVPPKGSLPSGERLWTNSFFRLAILNLFVFACHNFLSATFPFYIKSLGGSDVQVGLAAGGMSLCALFARPIAGWVLDNISRRGMLLLALCGIIAFSLLYLLVPILPIVIVLRWFSGTMSSSAGTATNTLACDIVPKSRFAEGIGMFGLTNSLASATAPALGLMIMQRSGFDTLFIINCGIALVALMLAIKAPAKAVGKAAGQPRQKLKLNQLLNRAALPAAAVSMLATAPFGALNAFAALYGQDSGLGSGGYYFMLMACGTALTRAFSGKLADRKGEGPLVYIGCTCFIISISLILMQYTPCYYLSALFFGLGFGTSSPALQTMAVRTVPTEQRGAASSTFLCSFDLGIALGSLLAGWLVNGIGYTAMFATLIGFAIAALLCYRFWASKTPSAFKNFQAANRLKQSA